MVLSLARIRIALEFMIDRKPIEHFLLALVSSHLSYALTILVLPVRDGVLYFCRVTDVFDLKLPLSTSSFEGDMPVFKDPGKNPRHLKAQVLDAVQACLTTAYLQQHGLPVNLDDVIPGHLEVVISPIFDTPQQDD